MDSPPTLLPRGGEEHPVLGQGGCFHRLRAADSFCRAVPLPVRPSMSAVGGCGGAVQTLAGSQLPLHPMEASSWLIAGCPVQLHCMGHAHFN